LKIILLDRGDRPKLTEWVKKRFKKYDVICPDLPPTEGKVDIVPRLREGLLQAGNTDFIYIIENDDYYPEDYIERMEAQRLVHDVDWIGSDKPIYYNVSTSRYQQMSFNRVSGLFTMGFKPHVIDHTGLCPDDNYAADSWISRHVHRSYLKWMLFNDHGAVGIKGHGVGKMASGGHRLLLNHPDPDERWLKAHTSEDFIKLHYG
jgi:hypothetical protein